MFPFRFYTAFDVLSDLENFSQESYKEPKKTIGNAQLISKCFMILSPGGVDFFQICKIKKVVSQKVFQTKK